MYTFLRYIYSLVVFLTLPLIFLSLFIRSLKVPSYRQRWLERMGFSSFVMPAGGIWVHAVSVGEVVAALPLISAIQVKYPKLAIMVTTTTPTGSARLRQSLGDSVWHVLMPYDLSLPISCLLKKIKPCCLIIMETELWPNLLASSQRYNVPVVLANGRISDRSFKGYARFKYFVSQMLKQVTLVLAQTEQDSMRFKFLGIDANKVQITGNLKFDVQAPNLHRLVQELKPSLAGRLVWVAASTHPGEEEQIISAYNTVRAQLPQCLLILVPRHPARFEQVAKLLEKHSLTYIRRSHSAVCGADTMVLLGDTMGELNVFYAVADLAFVGGSLVDIGGHNLLEPAAFGVPIISGPYVSNFKDISEKLLQAEAMCIVHNSHQLSAKVLQWLEQSPLRKQIGAHGLAVIEQNRGATDNVVQTLTTYLPHQQ